MNVLPESVGKVAAFRPVDNRVGMVRSRLKIAGVWSTVYLGRQAGQFSARAQFTPTLGDDVYLYPFGQELGAYMVGGKMFADDCGSVDGDLGGLMRYYESVNVSAAARSVRCVLDSGSLTLISYLLGIEFSSTDTTNLTTDFTLRFVVPSRSGRFSGGSGGGGSFRRFPPSQRNGGRFSTGSSL